jgi:hypothetical protein
MKKIFYIGVLGITCSLIFSCKKDWLQREPKSILQNEEVWNDPRAIISLLANFYNRIPTDMGLDGGGEFQWRRMADYDDAMWSGGSNEDGRNNITQYATNRWELWDYDLIRDINLTIENINTRSTSIKPEQKKLYIAELRFIRGWMYFELCRRMGGVPIVTSQLVYEYDGNVEALRLPRAKEHEVYDFVASEMDAIKPDLGNVVNTTASYSRANRYTAMALKSRAMLYAASIAKYNSLRPVPITTPGGEVGIPGSMANAYYQKSLDASLEVINSNFYSLKTNPADPASAFYEAVTKKASNKEVIFVKDYLASKDKRHFFTYDNIVRGVREDNLSSSNIAPSLNLVESYEFLDGSPGTLKTRTPDNSDYIYYDNPQDVFANKDGRMGGTLIYPNSVFKGSVISIQAGVKVWGGSAFTTVEGSQISTTYTDGKILTGSSGPHRSIQDVTNTGFALRKYVDDGLGTSTRGIRSDNWWVWIRLSEMYLNAAEAAFELGLIPDALTYVNKVRERAGFGANSLTTLTLARIQNEFRAEFAFEDHRVWDLKRWRIADQVWNGQNNNPNAVVGALYPYRVIRPGHPTDGKYVFDKISPAPRMRAPRFFREQNYYTFIPQNVLNNNPKIVRNPFQ